VRLPVTCGFSAAPPGSPVCRWRQRYAENACRGDRASSMAPSTRWLRARRAGAARLTCGSHPEQPPSAQLKPNTSRRRLQPQPGRLPARSSSRQRPHRELTAPGRRRHCHDRSGSTRIPQPLARLVRYVHFTLICAHYAIVWMTFHIKGHGNDFSDFLAARASEARQRKDNCQE
jgi:hypothetical protein